MVCQDAHVLDVSEAHGLTNCPDARCPRKGEVTGDDWHCSAPVGPMKFRNMWWSPTASGLIQPNGYSWQIYSHIAHSGGDCTTSQGVMEKPRGGQATSAAMAREVPPCGFPSRPEQLRWGKDGKDLQRCLEISKSWQHYASSIFS